MPSRSRSQQVFGRLHGALMYQFWSRLMQERDNIKSVRYLCLICVMVYIPLYIISTVFVCDVCEHIYHHGTLEIPDQVCMVMNTSCNKTPLLLDVSSNNAESRMVSAWRYWRCAWCALCACYQIDMFKKSKCKEHFVSSRICSLGGLVLWCNHARIVLAAVECTLWGANFACTQS